MDFWNGMVLGAALGFVLGGMWNTMVGMWQSSQNTKERQLLINKLLSGGDAAQVYNLNLADTVSQSKQAVQAAVEHEVQRKDEPEPIVEPWADHPDYAGCDVSFDIERDKVMVFDPDAADGPDCWEEDIDTFNAKLEETPLTSR